MAATACNKLGLHDAELSIAFVGRQRMRNLNHRYRGKNKSTDVLSFSQVSFSRPLKIKTTKKIKITQSPPFRRQFLGDIVISYLDAAQNARECGHSPDQEVGLLIVHGILHLCGHDHEIAAEERVMFKEQNELMKLLGRGPGKRTSAPMWRNCITPRGTK